MKPKQILRMHEALGDRYLNLCSAAGVSGPMVGWFSNPEGTETTAFIFWDDHEAPPENVDGPRDMLADLVFDRVRVGLVMRSGRN